MEPLSKGEKMVDWVMKHVMPWFLLVLFVFAMFMAVTGMMGWWD